MVARDHAVGLPLFVSLGSGAGFRRRVGLALTVIPILLQAGVVRMFGVNTLIADELSDVPFVRTVRDGGHWIRLLFGQLNEHRMVSRKLVLAFLSRWTRWNVLADMYFSVLLAGLIVWGLWKIYHSSTGRGLLAFSPQAWIVCGLGQWFNMTTGIQMAFYFTVLGWVWALYFLTRPSAAALVSAGFFGVLASFSTLNGALIWPAGWLLLVLSRAPRRRTVGWLGAAIASTAGYFWHFHGAGSSSPLSAAISKPVSTMIFFVRLVGAPIGAGNLSLALGFGCVLMLSVGAVLLRRSRREPAVAALLVLGLGSAAMISAGRVAFGRDVALQSSYTTFSSLLVIGLLMIHAGSRSGRLPTAILAAAVVGFAVTEINGLHQAEKARSLRVRQKVILQTYSSRTDKQLNGVFVDVEDLREKISYLEKRRLSVFRDPIDALFIERWREGRPARNILPGSPVRQTMISPVASLRDVSVAFATYKRSDSCHVTMSLWTDQDRIASETVLCSDIQKNRRVVLDVKPAIRSASGRSFEIRIESPDATAGNSLTVWMYPSNFPGELTQPGNRETAGRSLGIELNAHRQNPIFGWRE